MENIERILKLGATGLALIVPIILMAGYSYHLGYITGFGLDADLIPKRLPDVLVESWYVSVMALAWLFSKWLYFLAMFSIVFLLFIMMFLVIRKAKESRAEWLFQEVNKENQGRKFCGVTHWHWICIGQVFNNLATWFLLPLWLLAITLLFVFSAYQHGNKSALKQTETFQNLGCESKDKTLTCISLIDTSEQQGKVLTQGILITANQGRIAIFNDKLEVWPLLDSYMISKQIAVNQDSSSTD